MSKQLLLQRTLSALKQGSTLSIRSRIPYTDVLIKPSWREDGQLSVFHSSSSHQLKVMQRGEGEQEEVHVSITQPMDTMTSMGRSEAHISVEIDPFDEGSSHISVEVHVPEKVNLSCHLEKGGNVSIEKKVEGDVDISTSLGDIFLNKIRGYTISLQAAGTVYSSEVLEAQSVAVSTLPGRVRAKRIHGSQVEIRVRQEQNVEPIDIDDEGASIDISSLYIAGSGSANLVAESSSTVKTSIRCKSHHGHVNAQATHRIELGGANGSFDVDCQGEASVHIDSLAPDSISIASSHKGLLLTMDRKLEADLRLFSGSADVRELARSVLLEDDELRLERGLRQYDVSDNAVADKPIAVVTSAFTEVPLGSGKTSARLNYIQGYVENKSLEPDSRFEQKGGKIRLEGAAGQALHGFSDSANKQVRPLVVGVSAGRIDVESLSWLGAIARRYGLEESERKPELGRQATRRGRVGLEGDHKQWKD
ncbi:hypothetical protein MHU86_421 [Fragilaria crotonensis]|nr:hypothetical protein MHU86_421 [Fragilaria crotonensis]